jgi:hypothetical protein
MRLQEPGNWESSGKDNAGNHLFYFDVSVNQPIKGIIEKSE